MRMRREQAFHDDDYSKHPSIVILLLRGRVPGAADPAGWARLPLTHNTFQRLLGDPEAFTGQPGDVIQSIQNLTQRKQLVPDKENKSSSKMAFDELIDGCIFISPSLTLLPFQLDLMPPVSPAPPFWIMDPGRANCFDHFGIYASIYNSQMVEINSSPP